MPKYRRAYAYRYMPRKLAAADILHWLRAPIDTSWVSRRSEMDNVESAQIFADPTKHGYAMKRYVNRHSTTNELISALGMACTTRERTMLLEILGWHGTPRILPAIVPYIRHRSPNVRSEAADAIGKIALRAQRRWGNYAVHDEVFQAIGKDLLRRLLKERSHKYRNCWLAAALGAVGYRPATPELIVALADSNEWIRGMAAWSLGILRANEAVEPLKHARSVETESYARDRMWVALEEIRMGVSKNGRC